MVMLHVICKKLQYVENHTLIFHDIHNEIPLTITLLLIPRVMLCVTYPLGCVPAQRGRCCWTCPVGHSPGHSLADR